MRTERALVCALAALCSARAACPTTSPAFPSPPLTRHGDGDGDGDGDAASLSLPVLLTTFYVPADAARAAELRGCLERNAASGLFGAVHALVGPADDVAQLSAPRGVVVARAAAGGVGHSDRYGSPGGAYLYADLFEYANRALAGRAVVVSNADVVFGDRVSRVTPQALAGRRAFAVSRRNEPCPGAPPCRHLFCRPSLCGVAASYDAFAFVAPLPQSVVDAVDHRQDQRGAENVVVWELQRAGYNVTNPCRTLVVSHVHCVRNVGAYFDKPRVDAGRFGSAPLVDL
eukprot:m51a1_g13075 hypothetical protein (287) ;mRNA; f:374-1714